jgi:hypothetical protein
MGEYSLLLAARPSFTEGIARILDFGGTLNYYNYSVSSEAADQNAIIADWNQVAADLRNAMKGAENCGGKVEKGRSKVS